MSEIRRELMARFQLGRTQTLLPCEFLYTTLDPFAITLAFRNSETWQFSRDLLALGMHEGAGEGDVLIHPVWDDVEFLFRSPTGRAVLLFDRHDIYECLDATEQLVKPGTEYIDIDYELNQILEGQS